MTRVLAILFAGLFALVSTATGQTPTEVTRTASYVSSFQNPDGGFAGKLGQASSLGATSSAVRTLGFVGGSIRDLPGCIAYVKSCNDSTTGGFGPTPGARADVGTTAAGLMAVAALQIDANPYAEGALTFFSQNAKTFEEVRIAVAGLEAIKTTSPDFPRWLDLVRLDQKPDGTFGDGPKAPRATGSRVVALLRMGVVAGSEQKAAILATLRNGQQADGGWSDGEDNKPSDLGTSYRIMRAFFMMKQKPDLNRLQGYLARHRQADGGFAPSPGDGPSEPGSTYYCSIMSQWARLLGGESAIVETAGFVPLFNGKDLDGWEGDSTLWSVKNGLIVGDSTGIKQNNFLATQASYGDFILKFSVRLTNDSGNSGVQFRSVRVPGHEMSGYQADIGPGYWASLYDESRRNRVLAPASTKAIEALHVGDWNRYTIKANGDQITLTLNGVESLKYRETDPLIARDGRVALQIHAGGAMRVEFKDILIQPLPGPKVNADPNASGFHLRTVKASGVDRKYTVYVPKGYDGTKAYPAVLFLHGSGERGNDGMQGGQAGLGPAILASPDRFPAIVVMPQASVTWRSDSDDAKAALSALDDVLATYKIDRNRIALTGLSMGGAGAWSIASSHPERFSRLVTICGRGKPEQVETLKNLPTWIIVGDEDQVDTVQNARTMAQALRDANASPNPKQTEYRGVGHNSWDRAYNDPQVIEWMLSESKKAP